MNIYTAFSFYEDTRDISDVQLGAYMYLDDVVDDINNDLADIFEDDDTNLTPPTITKEDLKRISDNELTVTCEGITYIVVEFTVKTPNIPKP